MFYLIRLTLIVTVLLAAYLAIALTVMAPYGWLGALALLIAVACRKRYFYWAYGTARFAAVQDLPHLLEGSGVILGHIRGRIGRPEGIQALFDRGLTARRAVSKCLTSLKHKQPPQLVRLTDAVHTAVFAPTGVGKGVSIVLPHLLTCRDSMVVVDFKGELAKQTAAARRRMGQRVVVLDPFGVAGGKDTFNPLEFIDPASRHALDECRDLAEALVVRTGQEKEPHWNDSAEVWIAAMTAMVVAFGDEDNKSLQSLRALLTHPDKMAAAIRLMCASEEVWEGMLARLGHQLTHFKDKELSSTLTSTNRFLRFLDTISVASNTRRSSFDPAELLAGKMTVYLVLPPEHLRAQAALLRLWIGSLLRAVVRGGLSDRRVHFVLDEAASLSRLEAIDDAVDKYRGYGVRLLFLYQSLGQLSKCFPEGQEQTLLSNVTQVFFGVNDPQTAEYVSNRLGEFTQVVASGGINRGTSRQTTWQSGGGSSSSGTSSGSSTNWQQAGRKLLQPSEVTALDPRIAITFHPGVPPIATRLVRHYEGNFRTDNGIGFFRAAFHTACLFLSVALFAVTVTAVLVGNVK